MNEKTVLLTYKLYLKVAPQQFPALLRTFLDYNKACNALSQFAHAKRVFNQTRLGICQYQYVRHDLDLPMSLARTTIRKVASVYANRRYRKREKPVLFSPHSAVLYDRTGCTIRHGFVELKMSDGQRLSIPYSCSPKMPDGWEKNWTEARLVKRNGFCLEIVVRVPCSTPINVVGVLGIDPGVVNIATDSDGVIYASGEEIISVRKKYAKIKSSLQKKGARKRKQGKNTRSIRRKLKRVSYKEKCAIGNIIHRVAKTIVTRAKDTNRAIAMERPRIRYRKSLGHEDTVVRPRRNNGLWPFGRLGKYVAYKAALAGVPFVFCPPEYSSQVCPACGYTSRDNRQPFRYFSCRVCGFSGASDKIAAINISRRGARILMAAGLSLPAYSTPGEYNFASFEAKSREEEPVVGYAEGRT